MLDENLPTYHYKPSTENPHNTILHLTHNGSDPSPTYLLRRPDPASPTSKNRYAVALADPSFPDVIYGEILVEPKWEQPSLSAAEARAAGADPPRVPVIPDSFTVQLYNPDQQVVITRKKESGGFGIKSEKGYEFEMPEQSFRAPSSSAIDRAASDPPATDLVPRVLFRWKRDGRLTRDGMTCFLAGRAVSGKKAKGEPDITVALYRQKERSSMLTVYEPNMQRVEVEDRKGLEVVLVLGAEAVRELWLSPRQDVFNLSGAAVVGGRKGSVPVSSSSSSSPPRQQAALANVKPSAGSPKPAVDAETKRLQAMVAEEERQREKRDRAEQERIRKMLEREEKERRKREAQIERETEELRKKYGVEGQSLPSSSSASSSQQQRPSLPPRPQQQSSPPQQQHQWQNQQHLNTWSGQVPPARPVSAGPFMRPQQQQQQTVQFAGPPAAAAVASGGGRGGGSASGGRGGGHGHQHLNFGKHQKKVDGIVSALSPYAGPAAASVSGFFHHGARGKEEEQKKKVQKKRSVHF